MKNWTRGMNLRAVLNLSIPLSIVLNLSRALKTLTLNYLKIKYEKNKLSMILRAILKLSTAPKMMKLNIFFFKNGMEFLGNILSTEINNLKIVKFDGSIKY